MGYSNFLHLCGSASCSPESHSAITLFSGYGMTEASPVTHLTPKDKFVLGSTGVTIPNTKSKIINIETGEVLGPNDGEGELCVQGPQVFIN